MKTSPFAPSPLPELPAIAGVKLAVAECAVRYTDRPDALLAVFAPGTTAAGVFTRIKVIAAPVVWCKKAVKAGGVRALVVNAGNANAFTGAGGMQSVKRIAQAAAKEVGCKAEQVATASTGVIGEPLPDGKIIAELPKMKARLSATAWKEATQAIMTTDTFLKMATRRARIGKTRVTINGFAKGSGMIAPDMATLLAFVFTDAKIPARVLQALLAEGNERSFNCTTVDSDTSTNDTLLAFATGQAEHAKVKSAKDAPLAEFKKAFFDLLTDLAVQVVADGEGAEKLVRIEVTGAASDKAARAIGLTVANSPLVKTAIAGEDANWGRIVAAAGRAGEKLDENKLKITIGGVLVAAKGGRVKFYDETPVSAHMRGRKISIRIDLGLGKGSAVIHTCDLTHGYIDINGSYRS